MDSVLFLEIENKGAVASICILINPLSDSLTTFENICLDQ